MIMAEIKIKEFEERAKQAVEELVSLLGAKQIEVCVKVDPFEKYCKTTIQFFSSESKNACGTGNNRAD